MQIRITAGNSSKRDAKEAIGKYQESGNDRRVTRHRLSVLWFRSHENTQTETTTKTRQRH